MIDTEMALFRVSKSILTPFEKMDGRMMKALGALRDDRESYVERFDVRRYNISRPSHGVIRRK